MKQFFFSGVLVLLVSLASCKNDKTIETPKAEEDKSFNVILDLVVQKDDNFQIYYNEDGSDLYPADKYVDVAVKGKNEPQEIIFKLPEDAAPSSLRFDLGGNKEQKEVKILNFRMKYFDKKFEAKDTLFIYYFGNNNQVEYIRDKAIAKPKPIEGEPYDPIFTATESLKTEISKMVK